MDIGNILEYLKTSIRDVYKTEGSYFDSVRGRERSVVFRIAHNLANRIEGKENIYVDIEANRCNGDVKRNTEGNTIFPDLIVHKREGTGYLVAEFKCGNRNASKDFAKLELFTMDKRMYRNLNKFCPTYKLGIFVRLKDNEVEYTLFENGEKIKTEVITL